MDERLQELAKESGMTQYVAANNKYLMRFAALVALECGDLVVEGADGVGQSEVRLRIKQDILDAFKSASA